MARVFSFYLYKPLYVKFCLDNVTAVDVWYGFGAVVTASCKKGSSQLHWCTLLGRLAGNLLVWVNIYYVMKAEEKI